MWDTWWHLNHAMHKKIYLWDEQQIQVGGLRQLDSIPVLSFWDKVNLQNTNIISLSVQEVKQLL